MQRSSLALQETLVFLLLRIEQSTFNIMSNNLVDVGGGHAKDMTTKERMIEFMFRRSSARRWNLLAAIGIQLVDFRTKEDRFIAFMGERHADSYDIEAFALRTLLKEVCSRSGDNLVVFIEAPMEYNQLQWPTFDMVDSVEDSLTRTMDMARLYSTVRCKNILVEAVDIRFGIASDEPTVAHTADDEGFATLTTLWRLSRKLPHVHCGEAARLVIRAVTKTMVEILTNETPGSPLSWLDYFSLNAAIMDVYTFGLIVMSKGNSLFYGGAFHCKGLLKLFGWLNIAAGMLGEDVPMTPKFIHETEEELNFYAKHGTEVVRVIKQIGRRVRRKFEKRRSIMASVDGKAELLVYDQTAALYENTVAIADRLRPRELSRFVKHVPERLRRVAEYDDFPFTPINKK
jgi:hypothetical protein